MASEAHHVLICCVHRGAFRVGGINVMVGEKMAVTYMDQSWTAKAACAGVDPDSLFVRGSAQRQARQVCLSCEVRVECLADALNSHASFGVWGGLTERERRVLARRCPNEKHWFERLSTSDEAFAVDIRSGKVPRLSLR